MSEIARPTDLKKISDRNLARESSGRDYFKRLGIACVDGAGAPLARESLIDELQRIATNWRAYSQIS